MTPHPRLPARSGSERAEVRRTARAPLPLALPAAIGATLLVLPLAGLVLRAPYPDLPTLLARPGVLEALRLSLVTATVAALLCTMLGVPLAWVLARSTGRVVPWLRALVTVPLVLPPVVGGVALLLVLGRGGLVGGWLYERLGVSLPFTPAAVVIAQTFVALPFLVLAVEGAFRGLGAGLEEAAATLGASRLAVLRRVTLPLVAPSLGAGLALAWARALGEFGATVTFAGNSPGRTQTMPTAVYLALESDPAAATALSLVLLVVCVVVLVLLRGRWLTPDGTG